MANKDTAIDTTVHRITDSEEDRVAVADPGSSKATEVEQNDPTLVDGHDEILEDAPGIAPETDTMPMSDLDDLSALGGSAILPDDLGVGDEGFGGPVDPGTDLGSTLLDDLAGDLSESTDGSSGMSDVSGQPELDDQSGWAMDDHDENDEILDGTTAEEFNEASETMMDEAIDAYEEGDDIWGDFLAEASAAAEGARQEIVAAENLQSGSGPRDETMPAPDDGTGGDPDADDFIGGSGDVDPAPETEDHGGGELIGGRGDVDPAPETEESGSADEIDMVKLGLGAVDPLDGESTLLGGDSGDLAEMVADSELNGELFELDDSLVDAEIGDEDV